jgi:hypothetical protein
MNKRFQIFLLVLFGLALTVFFYRLIREGEKTCPPVYRATGNGKDMIAFADPSGTKKTYISIDDLIKLEWWIEQGNLDKEIDWDKLAREYIETHPEWQHPAGGVCSCRLESVKEDLKEGVACQDNEIYGYYVAVYIKGGHLPSLHNKFFATEREAQEYVGAFTRTEEGRERIEFMFMDIIYKKEAE